MMGFAKAFGMGLLAFYAYKAADKYVVKRLASRFNLPILPSL